MTDNEREKLQKAIEHLDSFRYRIATGISPPSNHIAEAQEILENLISVQQKKRNIKDLRVSEVQHPKGWLEINPPLIISPVPSKDGRDLIVENRDLKILSAAPTHKQLLEDVENQIRFMWDTYAKAHDSELTEDAKELKRQLLSSITLVLNYN